jgi:Ferritin-like domain
MSTDPAASANAAPTPTRTDLLLKAAGAAGALVVGGALLAALPDAVGAAPSPKQDREILNVVLLMEEVQARFYTEALRRGLLTGELEEFARVVGAHERAHVAFLRRTLGSEARRRPTVQFDSLTSPRSFTAAAIALEDLAVAAYNGQGPNLTKPALAAAGKIVSVEARHAGWIRDIAGRNPAPDATDPTHPVATVMARLNRIADIKAR